MTTRPPLSPVASSSPVWLNSTVDMMSAVKNKKTRPEFKSSVILFLHFYKKQINLFFFQYMRPQRNTPLIQTNSSFNTQIERALIGRACKLEMQKDVRLCRADGK